MTKNIPHTKHLQINPLSRTPNYKQSQAIGLSVLTNLTFKPAKYSTTSSYPKTTLNSFEQAWPQNKIQHKFSLNPSKFCPKLNLENNHTYLRSNEKELDKKSQPWHTKTFSQN